MKITAIKTNKITDDQRDLFKILDKFLPLAPSPNALKENSILVATSKIVSITQGRVVKITPQVNKDELIVKEADLYLPRGANKYNNMITIIRGIMVGAAGIDESNGDGYYILLPENAQEVANNIREYLVKKFKLKNVGVLITDSRSVPLRRGAIGVSVAYSGFNPLNSYVGKEDIFGRKLRFEKENIADTLSVAAVGVMGEGNEQTPLALIEDIPFVQFRSGNPSKEELEEFYVTLEDDIFAPVLLSTKWNKSKK